MQKFFRTDRTCRGDVRGPEAVWLAHKQKIGLPDVPREDYYSRMYDPEMLSPLPMDRGRAASERIAAAESLMRANRCDMAKKIAVQTCIDSPEETKAFVLRGALRMKEVLFSSLFGAKDSKTLSPKGCALRELSAYLGRPEAETEKMMVVEVPVGKAWRAANPNPKSENEVNGFYMTTDSYVYELMAANHIVQTLYSYNVLVEKLRSFGNIDTVLDYGGGAGTLSILFKELGCNVLYADLPGRTYDFAAWRFRERKLDIPMVDLTRTRIENLKFNCILCTEVIEHLVNPVGVLGEFKNSLKRDELLVVSESCEYTEQFSTHLPSNKQYGGDNFTRIMDGLGFEQILEKPYVPQMIFKKR